MKTNLRETKNDMSIIIIGLFLKRCFIFKNYMSL